MSWEREPRWDRLRLRIVQRARSKGQRPLSMLEVGQNGKTTDPLTMESVRIL